VSAAAADSGDVAIEDRAQKWIFAMYQGSNPVTSPSFSRHNAGTGSFSYNALSSQSLPNGNNGNGLSGPVGGSGSNVASTRGLALQWHGILMSIAWTVFVYFGCVDKLFFINVLSRIPYVPPPL
jgi:hypothetical protein